MRRLLFVCTGNICRSPMAEHLLRHMLKERGYEDYLVASAGVDAMNGMSSTDKVEKLLLQEGIDCSSHRSQELTEELAESSYLILTMTDWHRERVLEMVDGKKVHLLKEYVQRREAKRDSKQSMDSQNIADPYGGTLEEYRICMEEIRGCLENLMEMLEEGAMG